MLMHEWLQFRDKKVRRLTEEQVEQEPEEQTSVEATSAAGAEGVADETAGDEVALEADAADVVTDESQQVTRAPRTEVAQPPGRPKTSEVSRTAQRARTTRGTQVPAQPKTAREVLESLQPSAEVRARLEAVLARQQRLPLDADSATGETRRPRRAAETREQLVARLLDPTLSLQETALLLGVCPTTVRRYTNRGVMKCFRTPGNQRRFKLSDVLEFMERREHGEV
ncbi:MAG: helix-turn-helix domain-containing protein [Armatimonadetes bacterium]|nr:helix-turn-helix domain-containing protein [Armatimonadota bacterium]